MSTSITPSQPLDNAVSHCLIDEDIYRSDKAYSASDIKLEIKNNPYTLWDYKHNPDTRPRKETTPLRLGKLFHTIVLEPHTFTERYICIDDRRTKKGKEAIQLAKENGQEPITVEENNTALDIALAVNKNPLCKELFFGGFAEHSYFWKHAESNLDLKCRCDWVTEDEDTVIDLKTTGEGGSHPDQFGRTIASFLYHVQAAHYLQGTNASRFVFVAVEKVYPFNIGVYELDKKSLDLGLELQNESLIRIMKAETTGIWSGYNDPITGVETLTLPNWAFYRN